MEQNKKETALLVMDVQPGIVESAVDTDAYLARVQDVVDYARAEGMPIIFVVVGFREGLPEVSERNKMFSSIKTQSAANFVNPQPVLTPAEGDVVVTKRRVSAFAGSDLEVILRAKGVRHLVLGGIATSGVVLSTVREAADKDYGLTVLSDLCVDRDAQVQETLLENVFPRQAEVMTSEEWMH